jgi:hypothetical protein
LQHPARKVEDEEQPGGDAFRRWLEEDRLEEGEPHDHHQEEQEH